MTDQFKIIISVTYEPETIPEDMNDQLDRNVSLAVQRGLLTDVNGEAVVETYDVEIDQDD